MGACAATLLAWWVPSWRWLTFLCGLLSLAYLATWSLVTESPQWLLLHGRKVRRRTCRAPVAADLAAARAAAGLVWSHPARRCILLHSTSALLSSAACSTHVTSPLLPLPMLAGVQGEATAALAAIAFANGTRPPEHPLADPTAVLGNTQVRLAAC